MPLPYRTTLEIEDCDVVALAEQQVQLWLERRGKVDPERRTGFLSGEFLTPGTHELGSQRRLLVASHDRDEDSSKRRLLRFTEVTPAGVWQVDTYALAYTDGKPRRTLVIEASRVDQSEAPGQVDPPKLVEQLLGEFRVLDSLTPVTPDPLLIGAYDVEDVLTAITDRNRTVAVIVASSMEPEADEPLRAMVTQLTRKVAGTACVFVVRHQAVSALNQRLSPSHEVAPGYVRTFLPRVDLTNPADGARHRRLRPDRFAQAIRGNLVSRSLQEAFAEQVRGTQLETPLPTGLLRQMRMLEREAAEISVLHTVSTEREDTLSTLIVTEAVPPGPEDGQATTTHPSLESPSTTAPVRDHSSWLERILASVLRRKGARASLTLVEEAEHRIQHLEAMEAHADQLERAVDRLEQEKAALHADLEYRSLELAEAEKAIDDLSRKVRYFRSQLREAAPDRADRMPADDPQWEQPESLEDLALRLIPDLDNSLCSRVVFTGDLDEVTAASTRDSFGHAVQRAWKSVRALYDYADLKSQGKFQGNVEAYLKSGEHDGWKVPVGWHAPHESEPTLNAWGHERLLPVPRGVPGAPKVLMKAHFKCDSSNTFAVRMHYFDDTSGPSGKIYIGYIGRHKTTVGTKNT